MDEVYTANIHQRNIARLGDQIRVDGLGRNSLFRKQPAEN